MISEFVKLLQRIELDPTGEDVADILWLSSHVKPLARTPKEEPDEPEPGEKPEPPVVPPPPKVEKPKKDSPPIEKPAPDAGEAAADLFMPGAERSRATVRGTPFRTPAAAALPDRLNLGRSLRGLKRRVPSRTQTMIDEEATVQRIADSGIWLPVVRPALRRWFDLALVVDGSPSMVVWRETIVELERLLARMGAFRNLLTWHFSLDEMTQQVVLRTGKGTGNIGCRPTPANALIEPSGQRIILIASDCVAPYWHDGRLLKYLAYWTRRHPVAVVQMLPHTFWRRTGLYHGTPVFLQGMQPGQPNRDLTAALQEQTSKLSTKGIKLPVFDLQPQSVADWAGAVTASRDLAAPGVVLPPTKDDFRTIAPGRTTQIPADERWAHFQQIGSPLAQELARYLAAAPLTLPVMRLVQRAMLPQSSQVHLAEFIMGGLVKRATGDGRAVMAPEFEFHDGLRELLISQSQMSDVTDVLGQVSRFVGQRLGSTNDFMAALGGGDGGAGLTIDAGARSFAQLAADVLARLGPRYQAFADELYQGLGVETPVRTAEFPAMDKVEAPIVEEVVSGITPEDEAPAAVRVQMARIVLLGDSGTGKSGLGRHLAGQQFAETATTHGQQRWLLSELGHTTEDGIEREAHLVDPAGNVMARVIQAAFLGQVDLALLVFDPTETQDSLRGVRYWLNQLAAHERAPAILVGARIDRGSSVLSRDELDQFCLQYGISGGYVATSARTGDGLEELMEAIKGQIRWDELAQTVATDALKRLKELILTLGPETDLQESLVSPEWLHRRLEASDPSWRFSDAEFLTALGHLVSVDLVHLMRNADGDDRILLSPELLADLAWSLAQVDPIFQGAVYEQALYQDEYKKKMLSDLNPADQSMLIDATIDQLLAYKACFRLVLEDEPVLIFPSLIEQRRPPFEIDLEEDVHYGLQGDVEGLFAELAVRMWHARMFQPLSHWRDVAMYNFSEGQICAFRMIETGDTDPELILSYAEYVPAETRHAFQELIERFLEQRDLKVTRTAALRCVNGHIQDRAFARERIEAGLNFLYCPTCGERVDLAGALDEAPAWASGVVAILDPDGRPAGAGFVVSGEGAIMTAASVLDRAGWPYRDWATPVKVLFGAVSTSGQAHVKRDCFVPIADGDIAVLTLNGPLPAGAKVLQMSDTRLVAGNQVEMWGYPSTTRGSKASGDVIELVPGSPNEMIQIEGDDTLYGFDGGPVWDAGLESVLGMVTRWSPPEEMGRLIGTTYAIPAANLVEACPDLLALAEPPLKDRLDLSSFDRVALYRFMRSVFKERDLVDIADAVGIAFDEIAGSTSAAKTRELITYCERQGILPELLETLSELSPETDWYFAAAVKIAGDDRPIAASGPDITILDKWQLYEEMREALDQEELQKLGSYLKIWFEDSPVERMTLAANIRELILYCERQVRVPELLDALAELRPERDWYAAAGLARDEAVTAPVERVLGIDISSIESAGFDFDKAARAGVRFAFIRSGGGTRLRDAAFGTTFAEAGSAGMLRGIYYVLHPQSSGSVGEEADRSPEGQARRFASMLKDDAELGAAADVGHRNLTLDEIKRFVHEFQKHDPYGRPITIFTRASFWNQLLDASEADVEWAARHPLWIAHWTDMKKAVQPAEDFRVAIPEPWQDYTFHQWTSAGGALAGQSDESLDLNYFNGSEAELRDWLDETRVDAVGGDQSSPAPGRQGHIFLSFSRTDRELADRLAQDLIQAGFTIWIDDSLRPGVVWQQAVEDAIESASCIVALFSPDAMRSEWVRREIDYGAAQQIPIVPIMLRGATQRDIPLAIADRQYIDFRQDYKEGFSELQDRLLVYVRPEALAVASPADAAGAASAAETKADQGNLPQEIERLNWELTLFQKRGDRQGEGIKLGHLGSAYLELGQVEKAIEYLQQALVISQEIGDRQEEEVLLGNLGIAYGDLRDAKRAIEYLERALAISHSQPNEAWWLSNLGLAYSDLEEKNLAVDYFERALTISRELADRPGEGRDLGNLGHTYLELGQIEKAISYSERALAISQEIGDRRGEALDLGSLGNAYSELGQSGKAIDYYDQALVISQEVGDRDNVAELLGNLGQVYRDLGQTVLARDYFRQALAILETTVGPEHPDMIRVRENLEEIEKLSKEG